MSNEKYQRCLNKKGREVRVKVRNVDSIDLTERTENHFSMLKQRERQNPTRPMVFMNSSTLLTTF